MEFFTNEAVLVTAILVIGFMMKIAGFLIRDEMLLRLLVAGGLSCDALFYGLRADPIWMSVGANVALVSINLLLIGVILIERTTWRMTPKDRALFAHFHTLNPGQFRRLRKMMQHQAEPPGSVLTREGQPVAQLMLVFADRIEIAKSGDSFPIRGPAFVGEVAFLTGRMSSADVTLPEGGSSLRLDIAELKAKMARAPALKNAMIALFGQELARKLADSMPMDRAALDAAAAAPNPVGNRAQAAARM